MTMDIKKEIARIQHSAITDPRFKKYDEDLEITDQALDGVNKLFNSILPHFPGWRQACPTDDDLSRLKLVWTKALMHNKLKTGKKLNLKAGITACEESETDWLPSVGKFIKWCGQDGDVIEFAERAYGLFIQREKQIDTVGQMVVSKHAFDLRSMKAADGKKIFVELYLDFAQDNEITPIDAFALTETVQLSPKQQKDADDRKLNAQNEFLAKFGGLINEAQEVAVKKVKAKIETGVKTGKIPTAHKSQAKCDEERTRQLKQAGLL